MGEEARLEIGKDLLTYSQLARALAESRLANQDWSGMPVPVAGLRLVLEPRYGYKALSEFRWKECYDEHGVRHALDEEVAPQKSEFVTVNSWWNSTYQVTVYVLQDAQKRAHYRISLEGRLSFTLRTLEASAVWPLEAEKKAQKKLAGLITDELFELYQLTGQFPEMSPRSQLTYLFRRGRPTIVLNMDEEGCRGLCALCLHPIGYYGDSWAGVMAPTDEVIAHLLMMRGSEEKFWANANQHSLEHHASGL